MNKRTLIASLVVVTLTMAALPGLLAEDLLPLPVSNRLVSGAVTFANGEPVRFSVLEGAMLMVEDGVGNAYGLRPFVVDQAAGRIRFDIFPSDGLRSKVQAGAPEAQLVTSPGFKASVTLATQLEVEVTDIRPSGLSDARFQALQSNQPLEGDPQPLAEAASGPSGPISDRIISGQVSLPDGRAIRFKVMEGEMLKIRDVAGGYYYGLTPVVVDEIDGRVRFEVFEITERAPGLEAVRLVGDFEVGHELKAMAGPAAELEIEVTSIRGGLSGGEGESDRVAVADVAMAQPISHRIVTGELALASGEVIQFKVFEGQMFKIRNTAENYYYGLVPRIVDEASLQVHFLVFEITEPHRGREAVRLAGDFAVDQRVKAVAGPAGQVALAVTDICSDQSEAGDLPLIRWKGGREGSGNEPPITVQGCCVTCGTVRVCGCAVEHDCGSCCTGPCCKPPV